MTSWKPPMPTTVERQTAQKTGQSFRNGTHRRRGASPPFFSKPSDDSEDFEKKISFNSWRQEKREGD